MYGYFFLGTLEEKLENIKEAEHAYIRVALSDSKNKYSAMSRLGDIESRKGNVQEAKVWYRKAINESPNEETYATHKLARLECLGKNYSVAIELLKSLSDQNLQTKLELVRALSLDWQLKEASDILKSLNPTTQEELNLVSLEKGKIAKRQNDIVGAKYHLNNVIASEIEDEIYARALHELAEIEYAEGNYADAKEKCQKMIEMEYDFDKCAHLLLGKCQQKLGIYNKALENFREATKSKEFATRIDGYFFLGRIHFLKGDFDLAIDCLKKSQECDLKPAYDTLIFLATIYFRKSQFQKLTECISALKEHYPDVALKSGISPVEILIAKEQGKQLQPRETYQTYGEKQAVEYRKEEAIEHIRTRHANGNGTMSNFSSQINIEELFEDIKIQLTQETRANENPMDIYEIDYPNAGYDQNNNFVHKIKVVVLPGTLNILTMYPSDLGATIRESDIKKQIESETEKGKVHSRIEKFNSRYARPNI